MEWKETGRGWETEEEEEEEKRSEWGGGTPTGRRRRRWFYPKNVNDQMVNLFGEIFNRSDTWDEKDI